MSEKRVFICQNLSDEIRMDSTSGGAFSALAEYVLSRNGVIYGAGVTEDLSVKHMKCTSKDMLGKIRGSKYVQSNLSNGAVFRDVQLNLKEGKWVLFSGTPCQIAGLNSFLGKQYDKLIMMDIVCYAIPSPGIWRMYLEHLEKRSLIKRESITKVKFRDKGRFGYEYSMMSFYGANDKVMYQSGPESNQFLRGFVSNNTTRLSCYECAFKGVNRISDFTVWDCYNIYKYQKKWDDNKGTSHIMVNSKKGLSILKELSRCLRIIEVDSNEAIASEPAMTESSKPGDMREKIFEEYERNNDVFDLFFKDTHRVKIERWLRKSLSELGIYSLIKRAVKK